MTLWLARTYLALTGWRQEGDPPSSAKYVVIAAPHTSNWDLVYLLALGRVYAVKPAFMAKHTLLRGPMGWLMRKLGGIPIRRDRRGNMVEQMTKNFENRSEMMLVVPAEGTRGRAPHWKSGFYQIALAANVPIALGFLDYERKVGGFGPELQPSGDMAQDMDHIRGFYCEVSGKHPDLFGDIRLREEAGE